VVCGLRILSLRSAACATVGAIACGLSNCLVKKPCGKKSAISAPVWSIACDLPDCLVKKPRGKKSAVGVDFAPSISICSPGLFLMGFLLPSTSSSMLVDEVLWAKRCFEI
jgi:hypothetical protein